LGEWVDVGGVIDVESAAREETLDAPVDGGEQPRHLLVARGLGGVELEAPVFSLGEDAVQEEGVEVDVQLEAAPEALDHRHGAAPPVARAARSAAIEAEHGPSGDAEHRAGEPAAIAAVGDLAQEGFQVLADDAMEDGALRGSGPIGGDAHGRWASEARAVPGSVPKTALRSWTARHRATGIRSTALRAESD